MFRFRRNVSRRATAVLAPLVLLLGLIVFSSAPLAAQVSMGNDPAEPAQNKPKPKILPRPSGAIARSNVDEKSMRELIERLVACGSRDSLSSWSDPKRGAGCGRDQIVARVNEIANTSAGKLQVVIDKFETTSQRTSNKPVPIENVYAILPGSDPVMSKTVVIISGHFDSRASVVMDPNLEAPVVDDDASAVAVSMECARQLSGRAAGQDSFRATLL